MAEVNLVPKIKLELLKARQQRNIVSFVAILVGVVSVAFVAVLAVIVLAVQPRIDRRADEEISSWYAEFKDVGNVGNLLTIQSQLAQIGELTANKTITSRIFGILDVVIIGGENEIILSNISLDQATGTLRLDAQSGVPTALESLQKTISRTKFSFVECDSGAWVDGQCEGGKEYRYDGEGENADPEYLMAEGTSPLQSGVSYGVDAEDKRVLRFTLEIVLNERFLSFSTKDVIVIGPMKQNVTDSVVQIPNDLFGEKAKDEERAEG